MPDLATLPRGARAEVLHRAETLEREARDLYQLVTDNDLDSLTVRCALGVLGRTVTLLQHVQQETQ